MSKSLEDKIRQRREYLSKPQKATIARKHFDRVKDLADQAKDAAPEDAKRKAWRIGEILKGCDPDTPERG